MPIVDANGEQVSRGVVRDDEKERSGRKRPGRSRQKKRHPEKVNHGCHGHGLTTWPCTAKAQTCSWLSHEHGTLRHTASPCDARGFKNHVLPRGKPTAPPGDSATASPCDARGFKNHVLPRGKPPAWPGDSTTSSPCDARGFKNPRGDYNPWSPWDHGRCHGLAAWPCVAIERQQTNITHPAEPCAWHRAIIQAPCGTAWGLLSQIKGGACSTSCAGGASPARPEPAATAWPAREPRPGNPGRFRS